MCNNNGDYLIKHDRPRRNVKRRPKTSVVRPSNDSTSAFRRFYQSGGRDYEQYRLWLQAQTMADQLSAQSTSSINLAKIKTEPIDRRSDVVTILTSSPSTSVHSSLVPRMAHSSPEPMRNLSLPAESYSPLKTSFESQINSASDYYPMPTIASNSSSSSLLFNWSVADVAQFIENNFPEKNLARKFIQQEIDGSTLPLLTEEHLARVFKMKLGPSLRLLAIVANIHIQNQSQICLYKTSA